MTVKKTRQPKPSQRSRPREPKAQFGEQAQPQQPEQPTRQVNFFNDGSWPPGREPNHSR